MNGFKKFLRRQWLWLSMILCILAVFTWSSGGGLIGGLIACAITCGINVSLLRWLLPERAETLFCRENFAAGFKYALPYLGAAAVMLVLSLVRTGVGGGVTINLGAALVFVILAVVEPFLICGPVLQLMMNRYARDDVGVFFAVLYTGLSYGVAYLAYGVIVLLTMEAAPVLPIIAQAVYISLSTMFLATVYLCSENFFLVLAVRIVGLLLERGAELVSPAAVNIYTLSGLTNTDCFIVIVIGLALGVVAMNFSTNVPPWDHGDFDKKKKDQVPVTMQDYRLDVHRVSRLPWKRKK